MTDKSAERRLIAAVRRSNPGADVTVRLVRLSPVCEYRDGTPGTFRTATLRVEAPGYRPTTMLGTVTSAGGVEVR